MNSADTSPPERADVGSPDLKGTVEPSSSSRVLWVGNSHEDLTGVVTHTSAIYKRGGGRATRNPNESEVRLLLEAGVAALATQFCTHVDAGLSGYSDANRILGSISVPTVMRHYRQLADEAGFAPGRANKGRLSRRWDTVADYQRDLLAYVFRPHPHQSRMAEIRDSVPELLRLTFGEIVELLASSETDVVPANETFQLQLALQAAFPMDPQVHALATQVYLQRVTAWAQLYDELMDAFGLKLAPSIDLTMLDIAHMFNVIVEGAYIRRVSSPDLGELSNGTHIAVRTIQMLLAELLDRPWEELASLRSHPRQADHVGADHPLSDRYAVRGRTP